MSIHSLRERKLYESLQKFEARFQDLLRDSVRALVATMAAKDPITCSHLIRVSGFSLILGRALNLSSEQLIQLEIGAMLHDIGKIAIPDKILLKPGPLTAKEFEIMKQHPNKSAEILSKIRALSDVAPIVKYHQERFDGTGYPDGLKGEAIPLLARVTYVVDAFDAMISDRPYRKKMSEKLAFEELNRCAGTQFDKKLVTLFQKAYRQSRGTVRRSEFFPPENNKRKKAVGE